MSGGLVEGAGAFAEAEASLSGVLLLDLSGDFGFSVSAAMLADFGATVVRVEPPGERREASAGRGHGPRQGERDHRAELAHRNKRSVSLDLERPEAREVLDGLIARADVVLVDGIPAELERRGLSPEALVAERPELIVARGSGFGPEGPDRNLPAFDELAAARTGMMPLLPQPGQPPIYSGAGDMYAALLLAFGVVLALHHREETGQGQVVDASLLAGNMYGASLDLQAFLAIGGDQFLKPLDLMDTGNPMSGTMYQAQDGRWVTLTMPDTDRWWPDFAAAVGLDAEDARFDSHAKRCGENCQLLVACLQEIIRERPADHWRQAFDARKLSTDVVEGFDYPAGDSQALRNDYVLELEDAALGAHRTLGFPISLFESPARLERSAPSVGQHTEVLLRDLLGYDEARIQALRGCGALG